MWLWVFRHEGPVWQVAWAHPMFGNILASCSYDRKVIIWKEENGSWDKMFEYTGHESSGQYTRVLLAWSQPGPGEPPAVGTTGPGRALRAPRS